MGILNAIFAPFIILYLLIYSFFRYFEVRSILLNKKLAYSISDHEFRNITRIHLQLEVDSIRLTRSGNSENSMNFPICLKDGLTEAMKLPRNTLTSSLKSVLLSSCGECSTIFLITLEPFLDH